MPVLARLRQAGFTVALDDNELWINPISKLTPEQRTYIRAHKVLLLEELRAELEPPPVDFDRDAFEERAAILEYDAGFSRDEAERRAYQLLDAAEVVKNLGCTMVQPTTERQARPLPVAKPEIVCCGDCAHSVLPPDTCPTYGWRLCGLGVDGGGGFGQEVRRCGKSDVNRPSRGHK